MTDAFRRDPWVAPTGLTPEIAAANVALARRFVEDALGKGDMAAFDEIVADDVWVSTGLKPGAPITSKAEYGAVIGATLGSALDFSTATMVLHECVATTDGRVVARFTAEADHTGMINGVAATGRRLVLSETHLLGFRDGKLVENYVGALNPLMWEMVYAPVIAPAVLA